MGRCHWHIQIYINKYIPLLGSNYKPRFEDILKKVLKSFEIFFENKLESKRISKRSQNLFQNWGYNYKPSDPIYFFARTG
jgi:hypothetical protein